MYRLTAMVLAVAVTGLVATARAEDKSDPTGTWKWSMPGRGGQTQEATLKLKLDGGKLTGAIVGRDGKETPIENASYKDGEVSFEITRERQGQKMTMKYHGKLTGESIKGKTEFERNGEAQSRPWEAKKVKD
jgi:hypothetical protein